MPTAANTGDVFGHTAFFFIGRQNMLFIHRTFSACSVSEFQPHRWLLEDVGCFWIN
jgi:hypothetical protein